MEPLISVIVPIYNVEKYLRKCIDSIINQTYENLEIICVDDGSTDNSGKICDEYAKQDVRIKVIHKLNGGLSDARNVGVKSANGQYITFVDGDDWIDSDYYMNMSENMVNCNILICGYKSVDEHGKEIGLCAFEENLINLNYDETGNAIEKLMYNSALGFVWNKLYKAELVKLVKFEPLMPREDLIYNLLLISKASKLKLIGTYTGYNWVQHTSSITHKMDFFNVNKTLKIITRMFDILKTYKLECRWNIYDYGVKILLADTILVGIVANVRLNQKEKYSLLHKLLKDVSQKRALRFKKEDPIYYKILWICFKVKSVHMLYYLSTMALKR